MTSATYDELISLKVLEWLYPLNGNWSSEIPTPTPCCPPSGSSMAALVLLLHLSLESQHHMVQIPRSTTMPWGSSFSVSRLGSRCEEGIDRNSVGRVEFLFPNWVFTTVSVSASETQSLGTNFIGAISFTLVYSSPFRWLSH